MNPVRKTNRGVIARLFLSLADDIILIGAGIWLLIHLGISPPWWFIVAIATIFIALSFLSYIGLRRNPTVGFENMVGRVARTTSKIDKKGTVKFGREQWRLPPLIQLM